MLIKNTILIFCTYLFFGNFIFSQSIHDEIYKIQDLEIKYEYDNSIRLNRKCYSQIIHGLVNASNGLAYYHNNKSLDYYVTVDHLMILIKEKSMRSFLENGCYPYFLSSLDKTLIEEHYIHYVEQNYGKKYVDIYIRCVKALIPQLKNGADNKLWAEQIHHLLLPTIVPFFELYYEIEKKYKESYSKKIINILELNDNYKETLFKVQQAAFVFYINMRGEQLSIPKSEQKIIFQCVKDYDVKTLETIIANTYTSTSKRKIEGVTKENMPVLILPIEWEKHIGNDARIVAREWKQYLNQLFV